MKIFREGTKRRIGRILIAGTTFLCLATVKVRAQQESTVQLQVNAEDAVRAQRELLRRIFPMLILRKEPKPV